MSIRFVCPNCDAVTSDIDDSLAGETIKCRECHKRSRCIHTERSDMGHRRRLGIILCTVGGAVLVASAVVIAVILLRDKPPEPEPVHVAKQPPAVDHAALLQALVSRQKNWATQRRSRHAKEFAAGVQKIQAELIDFAQKTFQWNAPLLDEYEKTGLEKTLPLLDVLQKFQSGPALTKKEIEYCLKKPKVFGNILKLTLNGTRPLNDWKQAIDAKTTAYDQKMRQVSAIIDAQIERVDKICKLVEANETDAALVACANAIKENPAVPEAWTIRGCIVAFSKADNARGVADLEKAMTLDKLNPDPILARGVIRLRLGDKAAAKADYQAAIVEDPSLTKYAEWFRE